MLMDSRIVFLEKLHLNQIPKRPDLALYGEREGTGGQSLYLPSTCPSSNIYNKICSRSPHPLGQDMCVISEYKKTRTSNEKKRDGVGSIASCTSLGGPQFVHLRDSLLEFHILAFLVGVFFILS